MGLVLLGSAESEYWYQTGERVTISKRPGIADKFRLYFQLSEWVQGVPYVQKLFLEARYSKKFGKCLFLVNGKTNIPLEFYNWRKNYK